MANLSWVPKQVRHRLFLATRVSSGRSSFANESCNMFFAVARYNVSEFCTSDFLTSYERFLRTRLKRKRKKKKRNRRTAQTRPKKHVQACRLCSVWIFHRFLIIVKESTCVLRKNAKILGVSWRSVFSAACIFLGRWGRPLRAMFS